MNQLVQRASRLAAKHHHGQFRKHFTGVPYIVHPARVAARFTAWQPTLCAVAWCHDLLEDTACEPGEVIRDCGEEVLALVQELTNPSKQHPELDRGAKKAMDREHIARCSWQAKAVKVMDRIDNLTDALDCWDPLWLVTYAQESKALGRVIGSQAEDLIRLADQILSDLEHKGYRPTDATGERS